MMSSFAHTAVLTCHPETGSQAVREIEARAGWTQDNALIFNYVLKADLTRLRIPPPRPPRKANQLWQHTCFEAFISVKGKPDYYELNFAPSGEWAAYSFPLSRWDAADDNEPHPRITMRRRMSSGSSIVRPDHLRKFRRMPASSSDFVL
jgi:hypothetical protein